MQWPLPKPAWLPQWLSIGDPMRTKQVPAGGVYLVCVRKAGDTCSPRTWQRESHPASSGTGRRATAPVHSQV